MITKHKFLFAALAGVALGFLLRMTLQSVPGVGALFTSTYNFIGSSAS